MTTRLTVQVTEHTRATSLEADAAAIGIEREGLIGVEAGRHTPTTLALITEDSAGVAANLRLERISKMTAAIERES